MAASVNATGRQWPSILMGVLLGLVVAVPSIGWRNAQEQSEQLRHGALVDASFLQDMAQHHAQAVTMANLVAGRASPAINILAGQIADAQKVEYGEMRGMLRLWGRPLVSDALPMAWMNNDGEHGMNAHELAMPGMASVVELETLRQTRSPKLDILFLQLMLRHHLGAIPMARYASRYAVNRVIRESAALMVRDQSEEAAAMQTILRQRGAKPLPFEAVSIERRPI